MWGSPPPHPTSTRALPSPDSALSMAKAMPAQMSARSTVSLRSSPTSFSRCSSDSGVSPLASPGPRPRCAAVCCAAAILARPAVMGGGSQRLDFSTI